MSIVFSEGSIRWYMNEPVYGLGGKRRKTFFISKDISSDASVDAGADDWRESVGFQNMSLWITLLVKRPFQKVGFRQAYSLGCGVHPLQREQVHPLWQSSCPPIEGYLWAQPLLCFPELKVSCF